MTLVFRRVTAIAYFEKSRQEIDDVSDLICEGVFWDDPRPIGNKRGGDSAFVHTRFVAAEGRVLGVGPAWSNVLVVFLRTRNVSDIIFTAR